jgi:hypothetical protein
MSCANNLRNIALALQSYESTYHCLPPAYTVDADGKPLHSWRTLILPFLEQQHLYAKIDLSKPWDDPANQAAASVCLKIYRCPSSDYDENKTTYLAVVAPGGCFLPSQPRKLADITDRRDLTLMVLDVPSAEAVPWMSPNDASEDVVFRKVDPSDRQHPSGAQAACADGRVLFVTENIDSATLQALVSIAGNDDAVAEKAD